MQVLIYTLIAIIYTLGLIYVWMIDSALQERSVWYKHILTMFTIWLFSPVLVVLLFRDLFNHRSNKSGEN